MSSAPHIPVLMDATLEKLDIQADDIVVDCTIGFGGHSSKILEKLGPNGQLIGIDRDTHAISFCNELFKDDPRVQLVHDSFSNLSNICKNRKIAPTKILADFGYSSYQLDSAKRGFSFMEDEPLDMRMNPESSLTAADILNTYDSESLKTLLYDFADLYHTQKFIENVTKRRKLNPVNSATELQQLIKESFHFANNRKRFMKCCSQVFQALRIEVNKEFDEIHALLNFSINTLAPGSRIVVITFHSLEDKLVKYFWKEHKSKMSRLNKHVIIATQEEIRFNRRSKSAKLRGYEIC